MADAKASEAKRSTSCPKCGKRLTAPASYAGRTLKCPQCETRFPCVFDGAAAAPVAASVVHPPGGFRMIEVADAQPKRSAAVELMRFVLGIVGALVGSVAGIIAWGVASASFGGVIGFVGIPLVGGLTGGGMRLGYGRFGDVAASGIAAVLGMAAFFVGWVVLSEGGGSTRGLALTTALAGALAGCVSYGVGLDGDDID